jgi:hypothetical protein
MCHQTENVNKKTDIFKRTQTELLDFKNTNIEMKNSLSKTQQQS